jgi:hypothetical protein
MAQLKRLRAVVTSGGTLKHQSISSQLTSFPWRHKNLRHQSICERLLSIQCDGKFCNLMGMLGGDWGELRFGCEVWNALKLGGETSVVLLVFTIGPKRISFNFLTLSLFTLSFSLQPSLSFSHVAPINKLHLFTLHFSFMHLLNRLELPINEHKVLKANSVA